MNEFVPTQGATAEDKAKAAKALIKFMEAGFPEVKFTKRLYGVLHTQLFGHIAHFDKDGFYRVWFSTTQKQLEFLLHAVGTWRDMGMYGNRTYGGVLIRNSFYLDGDPAHTWSDVERYLRMWIRESGIIDRVRGQYEAEVGQQERAQLARLMNKYPEAVKS